MGRLTLGQETLLVSWCYPESMCSLGHADKTMQRSRDVYLVFDSDGYSQDLACHHIELIQLIEEADLCLHPYHPSLADGLMGCPVPGLWQAEGDKHDELALLALQWKD